MFININADMISIRPIIIAYFAYCNSLCMYCTVVLGLWTNYGGLFNKVTKILHIINPVFPLTN